MSIVVNEVSKVYGKQFALKNVSFKVNKPEIVGFLGPNGAGKSTMMKILTTYIPATSGQAEVNTFDVIVLNQNVCLLLGDNFIFGHDIYKFLKKGINNKKGIFFYAYNVKNPQDYAVLNNDKKKIISIEEKPKRPKTNLAIPGIYFFDKNVTKYCKNLKKSNRGELEIVDLINIYVKQKKAKFEKIGRGISWLDMGSFDDLNNCSNFIRAIEKRQNLMIGSPEEIAWRNKWISSKKLKNLSKNDYGKYLENISS